MASVYHMYSLMPRCSKPISHEWSYLVSFTILKNGSANEGHLYPLEKQFIFIHKPAVLIRFDEIESVEFQRYAGGQGSTRNFDLCVTLQNTPGDSMGVKEYTFSGIDKTNYQSLYSFLSGKKIKILNLQGVGAEEQSSGRGAGMAAMYDEMDGGEEMGESSEDEDYDQENKSEEESSGSDSEDDDDLGSVVSDDSDLAEHRKKSGASEKPKKKKKSKEAADDDDGKKKASKKRKAESSKKKKKKKDPNAPKNPVSGEIFRHNIG